MTATGKKWQKKVRERVRRVSHLLSNVFFPDWKENRLPLGLQGSANEAHSPVA